MARLEKKKPTLPPARWMLLNWLWAVQDSNL